TCNGEDDDCNGTIDDPAALGNVTCGLGACTKTVPACAGGAPTVCVPLLPAATVLVDGCGNGDEDCDGAVDEDCPTSCVYVWDGGGDDTTGTGTALLPFRTIQRGIMAAAGNP